jgi:hypothetical protein
MGGVHKSGGYYELDGEEKQVYLRRSQLDSLHHSR